MYTVQNVFFLSGSKFVRCLKEFFLGTYREKGIKCNRLINFDVMCYMHLFLNLSKDKGFLGNRPSGRFLLYINVLTLTAICLL